MKKSSLLALGLTSLVVVCCTLEVTGLIKAIRRALHKIDKHVIRKVTKPFKPAIKPILKAIGIKKVKKKYAHFVQEVKHKRVVFTKDSYKVEAITPCANGKHDTVQAKEPVTIEFEDKKVTLTVKYCKKCGESFFDQPKQEL